MRNDVAFIGNVKSREDKQQQQQRRNARHAVITIIECDFPEQTTRTRFV